MTNKKEKVREVLESFSSIDEKEISKDGSENEDLDFDKLRENLKFRGTLKKLYDLGVTRKYLMEHFFVAGLTIGDFLEEYRKNKLSQKEDLENDKEKKS